jgi:hypothetical protein
MSLAYRSAYEHVIETRLAEVRHARDAISTMLPELSAIGRARLARALAGAVGIGGAAGVAVSALVLRDGTETRLLLGSTIAMFATYLVARIVLRALGSFRPPRDEEPSLVGEMTADLARIDASLPLPRIERRLASLETLGMALPLAAVSLLAPLTIHWLFIQVTSPATTASSFAEWIRISLVIVGHAHLALAAFSIAFAKKIAKSDNEMLRTMSVHREWLKAWVYTMLVSCVPGIILVGIPPVLVALTGVVFIPVMFFVVFERLLIERRTLTLTNEAARHSLLEDRD